MAAEKAAVARHRHHTVCLAAAPADPADPRGTRCDCGHGRPRHGPARHDGVPHGPGICTGRNLAGPCLWQGCRCGAYTPTTEPDGVSTVDEQLTGRGPFRVLVTGSRIWNRAGAVRMALAGLLHEHGPT